MDCTLTDDELNRYIAEKVINLIPCDDWQMANLGSAGGPVLMSNCKHPPGTCYPTKSLNTIHGKYSGAPPFTTSLDKCREAELVFERTKAPSYWAWLDVLTCRPEWDTHRVLAPGYITFRATARQRCEAMWFVMEGKNA